MCACYIICKIFSVQSVAQLKNSIQQLKPIKECYWEYFWTISNKMYGIFTLKVIFNKKVKLTHATNEKSLPANCCFYT